MLDLVINLEDARKARMRERLAGFAARSDEELDDILGHVRHRIETAREVGVDVPEELFERVERLGARRGWPLMR
ncbi:hypothetical protein GCM10011579_028850 [Streptomyces albiflavescens]|uniref:Uncharacterized protein n=1 Tax=Streptomyces albiflavescens TaxID=1623582 RepID=A0A918D3N4_9ACTN|nr:hypothetical protein GCM10011579_028850 [Streptomyces albiflavescens]